MFHVNKQKSTFECLSSSSSSSSLSSLLENNDDLYYCRRNVNATTTSSRSFTSGSTTTNDNDDSSSSDSSLRFVSHLKNPIVHQLWTARGHAKAKAMAVAAKADDDDGGDLLSQVPRKPSDSKVSISYPFSTDQFFKEAYRNPWGQMRFGKLLEDLDALAGNIAFEHVQDPTITLVTASVDKIRLTSTPDLSKDQHLSGNVTYVGSSSMEIRIQCSGDDCQSKDEYWMEAYFTFVATDPVSKRPVKIPPLQPTTDIEMELYKAGERRSKKKKEERKTAKLGIMQQGGTGGQSQQEINTIAKQLLEEAGPLLNMPSLANPNSILVPQTELHNSEIAQPQVRNMANQIFGGFLMRRACELAYSTAYVFGGELPIFFEVDQIEFGIPVNVGDLKNFHARVIHSEVRSELPTQQFDALQQQQGKEQRHDMPLVSIEVEAWIIDPTKSSAKLSNQFYFTFAFPPSTNVRKVLPSNMDEARKIAKRIITAGGKNHQRQDE